MNAAIIVQEGDFSGPLDLLLSLIEKHKLSIHEISLASVTAEYLEKVHQFSERGEYKNILAQFLSVGSTLVLIKSRSLLPKGSQLDSEEETEIEELERRLKLFKIYKEKAETLKEQLFNTKVFARPFKKRTSVSFVPDPSININNIATTFSGCIDSQKAFEEKEVLVEVKMRPIISIDIMMDRLQERIVRLKNATLRSLVGEAYADATQREQKTHTIVGLLALLELVHKGLCTARQEERFSPVYIEQ